MRTALLLAAATCCTVAVEVSRAEELVGARPGIMCTSPAALEKLTLPGGDSRTHARPAKRDDLATASTGGCIDIPIGATVSVQQAFKNTSVVGYPTGGPSAFTIPNVDFVPASQASVQPGPASIPAGQGGAVPAGYSVAQRLVVGPDGDAIVVLEDRRIGPELRKQMWGQSDDPDILFQSDDRRHAEFLRTPLLNARIRLLSPTGAVVAEKVAEHPLAKVEPAPIHGLPSPTFLLSIDYSTGAGGFSGPATDVIVPSVGQLEPISYVSSDGDKAGTVSMASTLHAAWQIVPARGGGPEVIETVDCEPDGKKQDRQTYRSIRFVDGQWRASARQKGECGEIEVMPPRSMFP